MQFPKQEYWGGLPFPSPGALPDPGIELASPALAGRFLPLSHREAENNKYFVFIKRVNKLISKAVLAFLFLDELNLL